MSENVNENEHEMKFFGTALNRITFRKLSHAYKMLKNILQNV